MKKDKDYRKISCLQGAEEAGLFVMQKQPVRHHVENTLESGELTLQAHVSLLIPTNDYEEHVRVIGLLFTIPGQGSSRNICSW